MSDGIGGYLVSNGRFYGTVSLHLLIAIEITLPPTNGKEIYSEDSAELRSVRVFLLGNIPA